MKCANSYDVVRQTQIALFKESGVDERDFNGLIELFSPEILAEYLELSYIVVDKIPSNDANFETAGVLDRTNKTIYVSNEFSVEQRRLTGMHEIIHWMLHKHVGRDFLHRDRPITHSPQQNKVEYHEWEATNVACQYLMTEKMVKDKFSQIFNLPVGMPIQFNEDVAFYLNMDIETISKMNIQQRAMLLAATPLYGRSMNPLHRQFKVSPTAMAIRLQELELLAPDRWRGKPNLRIVS